MWSSCGVATLDTICKVAIFTGRSWHSQSVKCIRSSKVHSSHAYAWDKSMDGPQICSILLSWQRWSFAYLTPSMCLHSVPYILLPLIESRKEKGNKHQNSINLVNDLYVSFGSAQKVSVTLGAEVVINGAAKDRSQTQPCWSVCVCVCTMCTVDKGLKSLPTLRNCLSLFSGSACSSYSQENWSSQRLVKTSSELGSLFLAQRTNDEGKCISMSELKKRGKNRRFRGAFQIFFLLLSGGSSVLLSHTTV